ncbi:heme-binding protein 2-like [Cetorhinus maximus]
MLRLFLTVFVLFWHQLAALDEVNNFCHQKHCIEPTEVIQHKNYEERKYQPFHWIYTTVAGMDMNRAVETGLKKLFSYSHFSNAAGTVVPISAPWGVIGQLANGKIQQAFRVSIVIVPEVISPPEPTDKTIKLKKEPTSSYYARTFDKKVDEQQYEELVNKLQQDLQQDNRQFDPRFIIAFYNTRGLMQIGFRKK